MPWLLPDARMQNGTSDDTHCQIHGCLLPGKSHYRWLLWHEGADFLGAVLHGLRGYPGSGPLHGASSASADAENRTEVEESCLDTVLAA